MCKSLAIWAVVGVLGLMGNDLLIGKVHSGDRLLSDGATVLTTYDAPSRYDYVVMSLRPPRLPSPAPTPAPTGDGIFADVQMEMWNMENRLFTELKGDGYDPLVMPLAVE